VFILKVTAQGSQVSPFWAATTSGWRAKPGRTRTYIRAGAAYLCVTLCVECLFFVTVCVEF
jgi:hypothetical protein